MPKKPELEIFCQLRLGIGAQCDGNRQSYHHYLLRVKFGSRRPRWWNDVETQKCHKCPQTKYSAPLKKIDEKLKGSQ
jgi:hypothetical protein